MNGKSRDKPWFFHEGLAKGGMLEMVMGDKPNKRWGAGTAAAPPSAIQVNPTN